MSATPLSPDAEVPCLTAWLQGDSQATLGGMMAIVDRRLAAFEGVPGADDFIAKRDRLVAACDEVARRTECLFTEWVADIVADQAHYCPVPQLIRATGLQVKDPQGWWRSLGFASGTNAAAVRAAYSSWIAAGIKNDWQGNATGTADGRITLYPTPLTDRPESLWWSGWFVPGYTWEIDPTTKAPRPLDTSHTCPLPVWAHDAVLDVATLRTAEELVLIREEAAKIIPLYEKRVIQRIGEVSSIAAQRYASLPRRMSVGIGWLYGSGVR